MPATFPRIGKKGLQLFQPLEMALEKVGSRAGGRV
jgi:hypothetical protein